MRILAVVLGLGLFGLARLPIEHAIDAEHRALYFRTTKLDLPLREQIGQLSFIAALSGFRALVADALFIQANVAWERTEWSRVLLLFRQATTLQPRAVLFWDMAAWHMAWNASVAALNNPLQPRQTLRVKAQREYFELGRNFLEDGVRNNPDRPQLYEALGRLYREKFKDHARASENFQKASEQAGAPSYDKRFAAYELSYVDGREREAYERLRSLYDRGESERLPTLLSRLKFLEQQLNIPEAQRIP